MHQVTAYKFRMLQGDLTLRFIRLFTSDRESNRISRKVKNSAVGNRNFVGIASEVFNCVAKAVKGSLM